MKVVAVAAVMLVLVSQSAGLSCVCPMRHLPLQQRGCPLPTGCRGGYVMDPCDCCLECAKVMGEKCGGQYRVEGTCAVGLYCNTFALQRPEHNPYTSMEGLCTPIPATIPAQPYPGGGSYRTTLYPNLHATSFYNRAPTWGGYPVGHVTTTAGYAAATEQNNHGFQPSVQGTSTARTEDFSGGDQNNNQAFHPSVQGTSTARTGDFSGGTAAPTYNWQQFYPQVQQTTTSRHYDRDVWK